MLGQVQERKKASKDLIELRFSHYALTGEAYVEDLLKVAIRILAKRIRHPDAIPDALKKRVIKTLADKKHELALWKLASGWRANSWSGSPMTLRTIIIG